MAKQHAVTSSKFDSIRPGVKSNVQQHSFSDYKCNPDLLLPETSNPQVAGGLFRSKEHGIRQAEETSRWTCTMTNERRRYPLSSRSEISESAEKVQHATPIMQNEQRESFIWDAFVFRERQFRQGHSVQVHVVRFVRRVSAGHELLDVPGTLRKNSHDSAIIAYRSMRHAIFALDAVCETPEVVRVKGQSSNSVRLIFMPQRLHINPSSVSPFSRMKPGYQDIPLQKQASKSFHFAAEVYS